MKQLLPKVCLWLFSLGCVLLPNIGWFDPSLIGFLVVGTVLGYDFRTWRDEVKKKRK